MAEWQFGDKIGAELSFIKIGQMTEWQFGDKTITKLPFGHSTNLS